MRRNKPDIFIFDPFEKVTGKRPPVLGNGGSNRITENFVFRISNFRLIKSGSISREAVFEANS